MTHCTGPRKAAGCGGIETGRCVRDTAAVRLRAASPRFFQESAVHLRIVLLAWTVLTGFTAAVSAETDDVSDLAQFYGFSGLKLVRLNERVNNLVAGDLTGDGRTDLLVVDNHKSCLQLLRQRAPDETVPAAAPVQVNELPKETHFDVREIPVDKNVLGLTTGDFNSDGLVDLAYVGAPDRLIVRHQQKDGGRSWPRAWSVRLPGLDQVAWMISSGDLNGDGRSDIAVLGKTVTYVVLQNDSGVLDSPHRLINTSAQLSLLQIGDVDGDGRDDLSYMATDGADRRLCIRRQTDDGRVGPELQFDLQQPRSVTVTDIDGRPGREILTIDQQTGRLLISRLDLSVDPDEVADRRLVHFGIGDGASSGRNRALAIGDVDGDGRTDVVVTDPEQAQILLFRQTVRHGLGPAEAFPGLLGATDVCTVDVDEDGRDEVIVMSDSENVVAMSRFQNGRLTFPHPITRTQEGKTLAGIAILRAGGVPRLTVCTQSGARASGRRLRLYQFLLGADGSAKESDRAAEVHAEKIPGNRGLRLVSMDVNGDRQDDLLMVPRGSGSNGIVTFLTGPDGLLSEEPLPHRLDLGKGNTGSVFVHGRQLLIGRGTFARAMALEDGRWNVADQFNTTEVRAKISGAAAMDLDQDGRDEIVLIDTGVDQLRILRENGGLYRPWREVELGSLKYRSARVADLNGDQADDLLLFGSQKLSVLYSGVSGGRLQVISSWESSREDAWAADIIAGDLNGDGHRDLVLIDTGINGLEILHLDQTLTPRAATHFRVFEEKRLVTSSDSYGTEPREGLIADVTGDGRADLILLCHDQVIVYPQDAGPSRDGRADR